MLKFLFYLISVINIHNIAAGPINVNNKCCIDSNNKPITPIHIANYDCHQLSVFGEERCNSVFGGDVCAWKKNKLCNTNIEKCKLVSYYEMHFGKAIDVGRCSGNCAEGNSCKAVEHSYITLQSNSDLDLGIEKKIKIITKCGCDTCDVENYNKLLEIPLGRCTGKCNTDQESRSCIAGINDNFDTSNGLEISNPSSLLLSNYLSQCSAGVQSGFDIFIDNRCFGHTFTNCLQKGPCPLRKAVLTICLQAANVPLTNTDSMVLGANGVSYWGASLPSLNGGTWNQGETMCLDLDLNNLPGGVSILNVIDSIGHLDVAVQDDTAVDYLQLNIVYEQCQRCLPTNVDINTLYHSNGVHNFINIRECDCVNLTECHREEYLEVHFPGTIYETIVDKGQCVGRCPRSYRCSPKETKTSKIKAPEGSREITKIVSCGCSKLLWNDNVLKIN